MYINIHDTVKEDFAFQVGVTNIKINQISWSELKASPVGTYWGPFPEPTGESHSAEIVYSTKDAVVVLHKVLHKHGHDVWLTLYEPTDSGDFPR